MAEPTQVSLREAARRLTMPLTTLRRIVDAEPTLRACIRPGRPAQVDLPALMAAWQRLQTPAATGKLSLRQELALERSRRVWWQGRALLLQLREQEGRLCEAAEAREGERQVLCAMQRAMRRWAADVAQQLPGQSSPAAYSIMVTSINAALSSIRPPRRPKKAPEPPITMAMPAELPPLERLQADVERARAGLHQLDARQAAGELVAADAIRARVADRARRVRDQFLALAPRLSGQALGWCNSVEAKTRLLQGVSEALTSW